MFLRLYPETTTAQEARRCLAELYIRYSDGYQERRNPRKAELWLAWSDAVANAGKPVEALQILRRASQNDSAGDQASIRLASAVSSNCWAEHARPMKPWHIRSTVWYLKIQAQALGSAVLHADEAGWRVNGKTHWLWCFTTTDLTYFLIDRSRGSPALRQFLKDEFAGTLVTDFCGPTTRSSA